MFFQKSYYLAVCIKVATKKIQLSVRGSTMYDLKSKQTIQELSKAISEMAPWEALGSDCPDPSMRVLFTTLMQEILVKFWIERKV